MKTKNLRTLSSIGWIILAAAIISLSGCATKKAAWGSLEKGMLMKYQLNPENNLDYTTSSSFEQTMTVMNQEITITSESGLDMRMIPLSDETNGLNYTVKLEDISSVINTPRGELIANTEEVVGKSFQLTISPLGEELLYPGAELLTYDIGSGETKSLSSEIQAFFPNLPDHPIKIGDTWESSDRVTENSNSRSLVMEFSNMNTFEKIETYNGYDCMKINAVVTATIESEGEQEGMQLITKGSVEGTSIWYYAYKEGIFVGQTSEGFGETSTEVIGGPQEMTIPASRTYKMSTELSSSGK